MKSVLVIALSQKNHIAQFAQSIAAICDKHHKQKARITLLVEKSQAQLSAAITGVDQVVTIDSGYIKSILLNDTYSNSLAFNSFFDSIKLISQTKWDRAINLTNSLTGSYILSAVSSDKKVGTVISQYGNPLTQSRWETYQNFVCSNPNSALSINEITRRIESLELKSNQTFKKDPTIEQAMDKTFRPVRKKYQRLLGVCLENTRVLTVETLQAINHSLTSDQNTKVVYIHAGSQSARNLVNKIQEKSDQKLMSIQLSKAILPQIVKELDLFISEKGEESLIIDTLSTNQITISSEVTPLTKLKGTHLNLVTQEHEALEQDILHLVNRLTDNVYEIRTSACVNPIYQVVRDDLGVLLTQVDGNINLDTELSRHLRRYIDYVLCTQREYPEVINNLKDCVKPAYLARITKKIMAEAETLTQLTLTTFRSLKNAAYSEAGSRILSTSLEKLVHQGRSSIFLGSTIALFEGALENLPQTNSKEGFTVIEKELMILKRDIQNTVLLAESLSSSNTTQLEKTL